METAWDGFVSLCANFSVLFRVLTTIVIFAAGSAGTYFFLQDESLVWAGAMVLVAAVFEAVREKVGAELVRGRTTASRRRDARRILELAGTALTPAGLVEQHGPESKLVRANVMRHDRYAGKLCIWESYNMKGDRDRELEINDGTGVAGHVFQRCDTPQPFDIVENPDDPRATVAPLQANHAVRDELRSVLSVPIKHPFSREYGPTPDDKIGVLNLDSDLPVTEIGWDRTELQDFAVTIADLLAVTLER